MPVYRIKCPHCTKDISSNEISKTTTEYISHLDTSHRDKFNNIVANALRQHALKVLEPVI
jgi:hypothetical protein